MLIKRHGIYNCSPSKWLKAYKDAFFRLWGSSRRHHPSLWRASGIHAPVLDMNSSWAFFKRALEGVSFPNSVCNHQALCLGIITYCSHKAGLSTQIPALFNLYADTYLTQISDFIASAAKYKRRSHQLTCPLQPVFLAFLFSFKTCWFNSQCGAEAEFWTKIWEIRVLPWRSAWWPWASCTFSTLATYLRKKWMN